MFAALFILLILLAMSDNTTQAKRADKAARELLEPSQILIYEARKQTPSNDGVIFLVIVMIIIAVLVMSI